MYTFGFFDLIRGLFPILETTTHMNMIIEPLYYLSTSILVPLYQSDQLHALYCYLYQAKPIMLDLLPAFQLVVLFNSRHFAQVTLDAAHSLEISVPVADRVWEYQHTLPHPRYLGELAFFVAGLARCEASSRHIHEVLIANKIILPAPSPVHPIPRHPHSPTVNVEGITSHFSRDTKVVNTLVRRKVVIFLTFWHDECLRLSVVDDLVWQTERRVDMRPWEENTRELYEVYKSWRTLKPSERRENLVSVVAKRRERGQLLVWEENRWVAGEGEGEQGEQQGSADAVLRTSPPLRPMTRRCNLVGGLDGAGCNNIENHDDPPPPYSAE
ncbi:hypothetical protein ACMFMG_010863 [Clarireedia jacksonii]